MGRAKGCAFDFKPNAKDECQNINSRERGPGEEDVLLRNNLGDIVWERRLACGQWSGVCVRTTRVKA